MGENLSKRPDAGWAEPLWDRQTGESARAFAAFAMYRDLGPARSTGKAATTTGKTSRTFEEWCTTWGWVERAAAWDDNADRLQRERNLIEQQEARAEMLRDHLSVGKAFVQVAAMGLQQYDGTQPGAVKRIEKLSAGDLARMADTGVKIERLSRGESSERIEVREAQAWIAGFLDLALAYIPTDSHDAFLTDFDLKLGTGGMVEG